MENQKLIYKVLVIILLLIILLDGCIKPTNYVQAVTCWVVAIITLITEIRLAVELHKMKKH